MDVILLSTNTYALVPRATRPDPLLAGLHTWQGSVWTDMQQEAWALRTQASMAHSCDSPQVVKAKLQWVPLRPCHFPSSRLTLEESVRTDSVSL